MPAIFRHSFNTDLIQDERVHSFQRWQRNLVSATYWVNYRSANQKWSLCLCVFSWVIIMIIRAWLDYQPFNATCYSIGFCSLEHLFFQRCPIILLQQVATLLEESVITLLIIMYGHPAEIKSCNSFPTPSLLIKQLLLIPNKHGTLTASMNSARTSWSKGGSSPRSEAFVHGDPAQGAYGWSLGHPRSRERESEYPEKWYADTSYPSSLTQRAGGPQGTRR